ncbi:hypothetical protein, partial [Streptacidiphilus anmyonensis]|uniref:hypothetical protein n=1 Tax=Streptacidiphilus anmyonensis TaxID=405782 RepID=UPI003F720B4E
AATPAGGAAPAAAVSALAGGGARPAGAALRAAADLPVGPVGPVGRSAACFRVAELPTPAVTEARP